jgi:hypothetical protein
MLLSKLTKDQQIHRPTHPVFASLDHPLCRKRQRGFTAHNPLFAEGKERVDKRSDVGE